MHFKKSLNDLQCEVLWVKAQEIAGLHKINDWLCEAVKQSNRRISFGVFLQRSGQILCVFSMNRFLSPTRTKSRRTRWLKASLTAPVLLTDGPQPHKSALVYRNKCQQGKLMMLMRHRQIVRSNTWRRRWWSELSLQKKRPLL